MISLRNEIIEAQKARTDLIKWKLIMCVALGGTGLGFANSVSIPNAEYILCCIPLLCAYADIQCRNISLRIFGISIFLRSMPIKESKQSYFAEYGHFLDAVREKASENGGFLNNQTLESMVISGTSIFLSIILLIYSLHKFDKSSIVIGASSIFGIFFTIWVHNTFQRRSHLLQDVGKETRINDNLQDSRLDSGADLGSNMTV